jgi:23S rRNA pseudouridine955/2504/2580 synthase/23S rRNA pseudouridine1911/1915/1917 synthase
MAAANCDILFENEHLLVVNKPSGLLTIPDRYDSNKPNLLNLLNASHDEIFIVHRIDKETSGLVLFAKNAESHRLLSLLFENHEIQKRYISFTENCPNPESGIINLPIAHSVFETGKMTIHKNGKPSITYYKILESFRNFCMLELEPKTGRTHQIRVHLAAISCPILCDPLYSQRSELFIKDIKSRAKIADFEQERPLLSRTALHANSLEFSLYGQLYHFECPLPKDLKALLNQLRKWQSTRKL